MRPAGDATAPLSFAGGEALPLGRPRVQTVIVHGLFWTFAVQSAISRRSKKLRAYRMISTDARRLAWDGCGLLLPIGPQSHLISA